MLYSKLYKPCIGHKYKYIWYLVPKVGSRSLLYWLTQQGLLDERFDKKPNPPHPAKGLMLPSTETILSSRLKELEKEYFTFAFCRNPYDRLVSTYFDKVTKQELPFYTRWKDKSFGEFIDDICDIPYGKMDGHLLPQTYFIPEYIDFLGRFENLNQDIQTVTNKLFDMRFDNRRYNKSKHKHYSEYYDKRLRDKVYIKYKKDIETFNYEF